MPRAFRRPATGPAHDSAVPRTRRSGTTSSLRPSARPPMITSRHTLSCSRRDLHMDAVDPDVRRSRCRPATGCWNTRPSSCHSAVSRVIGRPPTSRAGAEDLLQRRGEVRARQTVQIPQRQHLRPAAETSVTRPAGSPRRTGTVPGRLIHPAVIDPRLPRPAPPRPTWSPPAPHGSRCAPPTDARRHPPDPGRLDVGGHLSQQRRRQHLLGTVPTNLDPSNNPPTDFRVSRVLNYLEHGRTFPNQRVNAGPDQSYLDFRSSSGRCVQSRHPARAIHRFRSLLQPRGREHRGHEDSSDIVDDNSPIVKAVASTPSTLMNSTCSRPFRKRTIQRDTQCVWAGSAQGDEPQS